MGPGWRPRSVDSTPAVTVKPPEFDQIQRDPGGTAPEEARNMSFILAIALFVVVVGRIDRRLPWPSPRKEAP